MCCWSGYLRRATRHPHCHTYIPANTNIQTLVATHHFLSNGLCVFLPADIGNLHPKVSVADLEPKLIKYGTITNLWVAKNPPGVLIYLSQKSKCVRRSKENPTCTNPHITTKAVCEGLLSRFIIHHVSPDLLLTAQPA